MKKLTVENLKKLIKEELTAMEAPTQRPSIWEIHDGGMIGDYPRGYGIGLTSDEAISEWMERTGDSDPSVIARQISMGQAKSDFQEFNKRIQALQTKKDNLVHAIQQINVAIGSSRKVGF
jgi:hypothetical protein